MHKNFDQLIFFLRLSPYQSQTLKDNYNKYNISRLVKRGGVLYAPHASHGFIQKITRLFFGTPADLIGPTKTLLCNQRKISFTTNGFHCVRIGKYKYYADASGTAISREKFTHHN